MEQIIPVDMGAEAFIELLNANNVDYIFLNPGTDTFHVQEAVAKFKALGKRTPEVILCIHESVAMAAAHGHFMVSGNPQVVFVHVDIGIQQIGGTLHNAQRGRAGILLCSGRVPSDTEKSRTSPVHWLQEQMDQSGIVRGYVKWDYELRTNENIHHVIQRALQIASSEPCGPVYLSLPQDVLGEKITGVHIPDVSRYSAASSPQADAGLLEEIASMLLKAENPLVITGYSGRHPESVAPLVELAELTGARVAGGTARMNFPANHPLSGGYNSAPYLADADVLLVIDHDLPYVPSRTKLKPGAKVLYIDIDPIKVDMPLWNFPVDIRIQADSRKALPALNRMLKDNITAEQKNRVQARTSRIQEEHRKMLEEARSLALSGAAQKPISVDWLCHSLFEVLDEDALILIESVTSTFALTRQLSRSKPGTLYQSGGSSLGWALGAAIGAQLASPHKLVVTLVGDGAFVFGCPVAALWGAKAHHAPFLSIIFNNSRYNAPRSALKQAYGGESYSEKTGVWVGSAIEPSPDYAAVARACHAWGQVVEEPADVVPALQAAIEQVKNGTAAVLDVRVESY